MVYPCVFDFGALACFFEFLRGRLEMATFRGGKATEESHVDGHEKGRRAGEGRARVEYEG